MEYFLRYPVHAFIFLSPPLWHNLSSSLDATSNHTSHTILQNMISKKSIYSHRWSSKKSMLLSRCRSPIMASLASWCRRVSISRRQLAHASLVSPTRPRGVSSEYLHRELVIRSRLMSMSSRVRNLGSDDGRRSISIASIVLRHYLSMRHDLICGDMWRRVSWMTMRTSNFTMSVQHSCATGMLTIGAILLRQTHHEICIDTKIKINLHFLTLSI